MHAEHVHAEQMHAEQAGVDATGELQPQAAFDEQRASAHAYTYEQAATYEEAAGSHTQAHTTQAHTYGAYDGVSIFKRIYFFLLFFLFQKQHAHLLLPFRLYTQRAHARCAALAVSRRSACAPRAACVLQKQRPLSFA